MHIYRLLVGFLCALMLTACGFHSRGVQKLSPALNPLLVSTSDPNGADALSLKRALRAEHVIIVTDPSLAKATLVIKDRGSSQQLNSLTGASEAGQYRLTSTLTFSVLDKDGKTLVPLTTLSTSRLYNTNAMQVLSQETVQKRLNTQMTQELNARLINRLAAIKPEKSQ